MSFTSDLIDATLALSDEIVFHHRAERSAVSTKMAASNDSILKASTTLSPSKYGFASVVPSKEAFEDVLSAVLLFQNDCITCGKVKSPQLYLSRRHTAG